jgi:HEAT repeat protein
VIQVLHLLGPKAAPATAALAGLIDDQDTAIARSAVLALASIGPGANAAVPALIAGLQQGANPNAHAIAYALGRIGPEARTAQQVLSGRVEGSNQDLALISAWALTRIAPSPATAAKALPVFSAGLASPVPATRRGSARSLGELGPLAKNALPALERAQKDKDSSVRDAATRAIARIRR